MTLTLSVPGDFATIPDALAALPAVLAEDVVLVLTGNLPDAVPVTRFVSAGGTLRLVGAATLGPVEVSGPVQVTLEHLDIVGGVNGLWLHEHATVRWLDLEIRGWSSCGIRCERGAWCGFAGPGLLDITGPGKGLGWAGIHLVNNGRLTTFNADADTHLVVRQAKYGFQMGFNSAFTHQGVNGTTVIEDCTTGVHVTDCSTWSTNRPLTYRRCPTQRVNNSYSWYEAVGGVTVA